MTAPDDLVGERRALFGDDPTSYEDGRPGYPARVFELLRERGDLGPGARVLEIGPGTGQATRDLVGAGAHVTAVELSAALAHRVRARHPDVEVVVGAFEDVELDGAGFDLAVAATAFHWVPTQVGLARVADLLRDGGTLALWWNVYGDHDRPDPFHKALVPILERLAPELLDDAALGDKATAVPPYGADAAARIGEIDASGRFGPVHHEIVRWTGRHDPAQLRAMFASFSPWLALPVDRRAAVLDELERLAADDFAGTVERPYLTPIYLATRR